MSKIINAKWRRDDNSGYVRVIWSQKLWKLISRVQSTVISNGTELERMICERSNLIENIDVFIKNATIWNVKNWVFLCLKKIFKKSEKYAHFVKWIEPDIIIFIVEDDRICKIIELKEGDNFDTKKAQKEKESLEKFATIFGSKIPFATEYYICSFNQEDKDLIYKWFKEKFSYEHILTWRELCEILKIDYDEIIYLRQIDRKENFEYFISELVNIPEVKMEIWKYF